VAQWRRGGCDCRAVPSPQAGKLGMPNRALSCLIGLVFVAFAAMPPLRPVHGQDAPPRGALSLNQSFVEGLSQRVNLDSEIGVFWHVFRSLPDSVTVYPTENYFYWSFTANGRIIWGNFRLDAADRDQGVLNLGYFEYDENGKFQDYDGWGKVLGAKDGVVVTKVSRFIYTVAHKGKTVTFRLFDIGMTPPKKAKLRKDEVFVGPVFDEYGMVFHLIFNTAVNHFLYIVNEDRPAGETFRPLKTDKTVLIGRRTGFAYYDDTENNRKILIGVSAMNSARNNYYDGPFDQLPDNYADETKIMDYIIRARPELKGKINKFGHVLAEPGNRVAITPYFNYVDESQLSFVASCRKTKQAKARFYACITPDR
jgi:hypothetical protein